MTRCGSIRSDKDPCGWPMRKFLFPKICKHKKNTKKNKKMAHVNTNNGKKTTK